MNNITAVWSKARNATTAAYCALITTMIAMFGKPAIATPRRGKALSFLEYAILAAAIVGVGVLIATFFRDTLGDLLTQIRGDYGTGV